MQSEQLFPYLGAILILILISMTTYQASPRPELKTQASFGAIELLQWYGTRRLKCQHDKTTLARGRREAVSRAE